MYNVLNKNDVRYQTTHATIRNAYKKLLSQKDYLSISVTEICKLAHINRGTFYIHYKDSSSVMNEFEEEIYHQMIQFIDEAIFTKDIQFKLPYTFADYIQTDNGLFFSKVLNGVYGSGKLYLRVCDYITSMTMQSFSNSKNLTQRELELLSAFLSNASIGILREWYKSNYQNIENDILFTNQLYDSILKIYNLH